MTTDTFTGAGSDSWNCPTDQTILIQIWGAGGGNGVDDHSSTHYGGTGGYLELEYSAVKGENFTIYGASGGGDGGNRGGYGGNGYKKGGDAGSHPTDSREGAGGGGGCAAILDANGNVIGSAGAGGGGGCNPRSDGNVNYKYGGGGGARGGSGGNSGAYQDDGESGGGSGSGGSGGSGRNDGNPGGTVANVGNVLTSTLGGGNDNGGVVKVTYDEITAPANVSASLNGETETVTISWTDDSTNEDNYEVYRSQSSGVTASDTLVATLSAGTTSYTDNPPEDGRYYYRVRAVNDYSQTMSSDEGVVDYPIIKFFDGTAMQGRCPKIYDGSSWSFPDSAKGYDSGFQ